MRSYHDRRPTVLVAAAKVVATDVFARLRVLSVAVGRKVMQETYGEALSRRAHWAGKSTKGQESQWEDDVGMHCRAVEMRLWYRCVFVNVLELRRVVEERATMKW